MFRVFEYFIFYILIASAERLQIGRIGRRSGRSGFGFKNPHLASRWIASGFEAIFKFHVSGLTRCVFTAVGRSSSE